jgi:hypothetical protein
MSDGGVSTSDHNNKQETKYLGDVWSFTQWFGGRKADCSPQSFFLGGVKPEWEVMNT